MWFLKFLCWLGLHDYGYELGTDPDVCECGARRQGEDYVAGGD